MSEPGSEPPPPAKSPPQPESKPDSTSRPKPEPIVSAAERRATRQSIAIGIVLGGVIGISLGLWIVSWFRPAPDYGDVPLEPIRVLPPRPAAASSTPRATLP
jgi:hypothetical protein